LPCNLVLLGAMSLLCMSRHVGLMWVASGATTLTAAPLIFLHSGQRTLEAAWKYIILCSVGVAFALLGIFFVAIAATDPSGAAPGLFIDELIARGLEGKLSPAWLRT